MLRTAVNVVLALVLFASVAAAAAWQWPAQTTLGGFSIGDIKGSTKDNGSGSATGVLQMKELGNPKVSLTRTARGEITGSVPISAKISGIDIQGTFSLTGAGLKGQGTAKTSPKPVTDATISLNPRGQLSGTGKVVWGKLSIPAEFSSTGGSVSVSGSGAVKSKTDTPLAAYELDGTLSMKSSGTKVELTADGKAKRTSKLTKQSSTTKFSKLDVDQGNGKCKIEIDGVSVVFTLF